MNITDNRKIISEFMKKTEMEQDGCLPFINGVYLAKFTTILNSLSQENKEVYEKIKKIFQ